MADDDEEDRDLARDALEGTSLALRMKFVVDGQDLIDYLRVDVQQAYDLGASSYITKPMTHAQFSRVMRTPSTGLRPWSSLTPWFSEPPVFVSSAFFVETR